MPPGGQSGSEALRDLWPVSLKRLKLLRESLEEHSGCGCHL